MHPPLFCNHTHSSFPGALAFEFKLECEFLLTTEHRAKEFELKLINAVAGEEEYA
jgi:hypothetical protein